MPNRGLRKFNEKEKTDKERNEKGILEGERTKIKC